MTIWINILYICSQIGKTRRQEVFYSGCEKPGQDEN